MWKRTNKKIATILVIILGIFIVSCKNPLNFKQEAKESQKAYISISANLPGSNARTVLPNAVTEETTGLTWELKGEMIGSSTSKTFTKSWNDTEDKTAYQQMIYPDADSGILLDVGTWKFTLTVYNNDNKKVLEATLGDESNPFEITKNGPNELKFVMQEATGENLANGQIEFELKFPSNVVSQVEATLNKITINDDNEILEESFDSFEWKLDKGNYFSEVTYNYPREGVEKTLLPGSYKLIIKLQQQNGNQELQTINTYSCLIYVAPGLLSSGSYTLESLAKLYPVTFVLNGGYLDESTTTYTLTYNKYQTFTLPTPIPPNNDVEFGGWYKEADFSTKIEGNYSLPNDVTDDGVTLYAKWERKLSLDNIFAIGDQDSTPDEVSEYNAIYSPYDNKYGILTITNPNNSSSVWDYYVRTNRSVSFSQGKNYSVSVDLKSEGGDTVVGIQAAYADMFFTVGTDWTTCTFETGFLDKELPEGKNGITIGSALASKVYISNLVITEIDDDNLPTLAFNVTKTGINEYLANGKKAENIIEVEKISSNDGYQITLNTDVLNVDLTIRDYATPGLNKTSFNISLANTNDSLKTSMVGASLNSEGYKNNPKIVAWRKATEIPESGNLAVYFPAYANNEGETLVPCAIEGIFSGGNVSSTMTIKNIKMEKIDSLEGTGKVFAIKTQEQGTENIVDKWEKKESLSFSSEPMNIPSGTAYYFDVLIVDSFEDASKINWNDCIRFLYSTSDTTTPDGKFNYSAETDNNNNDVFKIHNNNTNESCTCKITLTDDLRVLIEECSSANNDTSSTDEVEGISYASINDIDTFYISDSNGLNAYRDLINGIGGFSLSITPSDGGVPYNRTFETGGYNNYNAILVNDIEITDAWTPIGTSDHPFTSSFDGQGHSITINSVADGEYAGVFGYAGNYAEPNSIVNLAVKGVLSSANAKYVGGIVACSNGIKVENCINMASLGSGTYVGGIIGYVNEYTKNEVSKCINVGEIILASSTSHYRGGIVAHTAGNITISDCINLVELSSNGTGKGSGIVDVENTKYNPNTTVNNCINVGFVNFDVKIAIANKTNTTTIENCYYDSDKWTRVVFDETNTYTPTDTSSIAKSTSELCKLTTSNLSKNWSCVTGGTRYPLPDLSSVFTGNTIWQEICDVAKTVTEISSWADLVDATSELNDQPTVTFLITDDLTADSTIVSSVPAKILVGKNVTISRATEFTGAFFNATASLEIEGTEDAIITFDGKEIDSSAPLIITTADLSLSYCELKNNKNVDSTSVDYGGAICIKNKENDSNFYSTSFSNTSFYNNVAFSGGGIYCQSKNHSNEIKNCSFENNSVTTTTGTGAGIMIYYGRVNIDGITMSNNNFASAEEGNANNINSDIYIYNKSDNILNLGGEVQIDSIWFYHSSAVPTLTISDDISLIEPQLPVEIIIKPSSSTYILDKLIRLEEDATLSNVQLSCFSISRVESNQKVLYELNEDGSIQLKN